MVTNVYTLSDIYKAHYGSNYKTSREKRLIAAYVKAHYRDIEQKGAKNSM